MDLWEPAGWEHGKGKSAEPFIRARVKGGAAGNTRRTVCGTGRRCAIRLQSLTPMGRACTVGRSVPLPTFYFGLAEKQPDLGGIETLSEKESMEGTQHEV